MCVCVCGVCQSLWLGYNRTDFKSKLLKWKFNKKQRVWNEMISQWSRLLWSFIYHFNDFQAKIVQNVKHDHHGQVPAPQMRWVLVFLCLISLWTEYLLVLNWFLVLSLGLYEVVIFLMSQKSARKMWLECTNIYPRHTVINIRWVSWMQWYVFHSNKLTKSSAAPRRHATASSGSSISGYSTVFLLGYKVQSVLRCFLVKFNLCVIYFTASPPLLPWSPSPPLLGGRKPALPAVKRSLLWLAPPKLTTGADSVLRNTMEIRIHLTPDCGDQYY